MIQANVAAAETLEAKKSPLVYRIHDAPSLAKLEALRDFLASIDMTLPKGGNLRPSTFQPASSTGSKDSEHEHAAQRGGAAHPGQAEYTPRISAISASTCAATPISPRRSAAMPTSSSTGRWSARWSSATAACRRASRRELPEIAAQISAAERRAMAAERDTIDRLVAHWLADRVGATFNGRIAGVTRAGLFVKLDETGADGFVPMRDARRRLFPLRRGAPRRDRPAHRRDAPARRPVEVRLVEAAPLAGALRFELLSARAASCRRRTPGRFPHAGAQQGRPGEAGARQGQGGQIRRQGGARPAALTLRHLRRPA